MMYAVKVDKLEKLNGIKFKTPDAKWAEFVYNNRIGRNKIISDFHNWDALFEYAFGHVADGRIATLVYRARRNEISFEDFTKEIRPVQQERDDQLSFHTEQALQCLKFLHGRVEHDFTYQEERRTN